MTKLLPPAAQAVLDAYNEDRPVGDSLPRNALVEALRAAADGCSSDWMGLTVIHHLYAIADELEGN